jgi:hypothetical protein
MNPKFLLLLHATASVFLLGAITHQAVSAWWPARPQPVTFFSAFRNVTASRYATPIVLLYLLMIGTGALLYPPFRLNVREALLDTEIPWATGLFELKEHFAAVGLGILPAYWLLWRKSAEVENGSPRKLLTAFLCLASWWNFLVGHVVNNLKGL